VIFSSSVLFNVTLHAQQKETCPGEKDRQKASRHPFQVTEAATGETQVCETTTG
jgi:hypothetical protein